MTDVVGDAAGTVLHEEKRRDGRLPYLRDELIIVVVTVVGVVTTVVLFLVFGVGVVFPC